SPASTAKATTCNCGSLFLNWSKINIVRLSPSAYFAVRPKTQLGRPATSQRPIQHSKHLETNGRGNRPSSAHHDQLPNSSPSEQRLMAGGKQQQERYNWRDHARNQAQDDLRKALLAQNQISPRVNGQPDQKQWENSYSQWI